LIRSIGLYLARSIVEAAFLLGVGASTAGCSEDAGGCAGQQPCDITDARCQQAIFAATACERGQPGAHVPEVRTIGLDQYEEELADAQSEPSANELTWEAAYHLLGFLDDDETITGARTRTAADNVAAYYETETKQVTVIDRENADPERDFFILAHEFTHSLQDADVDLEAFRKKWVSSTDASIAMGSLIEGEAMLVANGVALRADGLSPRDADWPSYEEAMLDDGFQTVDDSLTPLFAAATSLLYPVGTKGLRRPWLDSGQAGIDAFYHHPRQSLLDWIRNTPLGETAVEGVECHPTTPPQGYVGVDHDSLGIVGAMALLVEGRMLAKPAYGESEGWLGDSVVTFAPSDPADTGRAVAWCTRWDSSSSAATFEAAARRVRRDATVVLSGKEVTIRNASSATVLPTWEDTMCGTEKDLPTAGQDATDDLMGLRSR
jgi:hypothetical protein